ncbi:MAG TPA: DUF1684 domain-containing protein [Candidatus Thermoplasmatota archaeon]|nr:DUF1684 domain-containing protein [Candidatus Thermoplasmatota archaeon]
MDEREADALRMRREKDDFLKRSPQSPIADQAAFEGLRYFPYDAAFRVSAAWEPAATPRHVRIGTSTGEERDYLEAGTLRFTLGGQERTLRGFVAPGRPHELFVPFRDATSGKESYGAARYLEVELPRHGHALVDFNLAYNPWCAYSESYSCPLPPRENWLDVAIRAGEMQLKA